MKPITNFLPCPKILFLDIGDTILGWTYQAKWEAAQQISHALGKSFGVRDFDLATCMAWKNRNGSSLKNVITEQQELQYWREFYIELLELVGVVSPSHKLVETLAKFPVTPDTFTLFDDTLPLLESACRYHVRLGVISNAFISVQEILKALQLDDVFEPLILSYLVGVAKPQAEIYRIALEEAKVMPHEAYFVDDRPAFVDAASELKMRAALLDRDNTHIASNLTCIDHLRALETMWKTPQYVAVNNHRLEGVNELSRYGHRIMESDWAER